MDSDFNPSNDDVEVEPDDNFDTSSSDDSDSSSEDVSESEDEDDSESEDEDHPMTAEEIDQRLRRLQAQHRQQREEQARRQSRIARAQVRTQSQRTNNSTRARLRFQRESEKTRLDAIRKQAAERKRQEELSIATVRGISKQCPGCSWPIQKRSGCDHMTCESSQPSAICWQLPSFMPTAHSPRCLILV